MSVYSVNQVRHLYVAKELKTGNNLLSADQAGAILPKADNAKSMLYFQYKSPGGIVSSDKIILSNVTYAKATPSEDLAKELDKYELVLDPAVNGGAPVAGQDYLLRLAFEQYIGLSEEDQYWKFGMVHAVNGMTASEFYKTMALSLLRNVGREETPLVKIYLKTASASIEVTSETKPSSLTGTYVGIEIEQVEQAWVRGTMPLAYIPFTVQPTSITVDGDEVIWGKVEKVASTSKVEDGKNIADLEYFCVGFRGDVYRNMGWPNVIPTTYLVDPAKKYDVLDIRYYWAGEAEDVQKSPRTLTLVAEDDGSHTAMDALITAINTASGLSIAKLGAVGG